MKAINKYFQTLAKQIETCSIAIIKFFIEWALVASIFIKKPQVITSEKVPMTHGGAYTMPLKYPTGFV